MIIELRCKACGKLFPWRGARYVRRCSECRALVRQKVAEMAEKKLAELER